MKEKHFDPLKKKVGEKNLKNIINKMNLIKSKPNCLNLPSFRSYSHQMAHIKIENMSLLNLFYPSKRGDLIVLPLTK